MVILTLACKGWKMQRPANSASAGLCILLHDIRRSLADSNRCRSFCRALPSHSAKGPLFYRKNFYFNHTPNEERCIIILLIKRTFACSVNTKRQTNTVFLYGCENRIFLIIGWRYHLNIDL